MWIISQLLILLMDKFPYESNRIKPTVKWSTYIAVRQNKAFILRYAIVTIRALGCYATNVNDFVNKILFLVSDF